MLSCSNCKKLVLTPTHRDGEHHFCGEQCHSAWEVSGGLRPSPVRRHRWLGCVGLGCLGVVGCGALLIFMMYTLLDKPALADLHRELQTDVRRLSDPTPPETPPPGTFELVHYRAPLGDNWAYVSPVREGRRPGVVYIAGGFDWGISGGAWTPGHWENDQSGSAFLRPDIVLMRPSLRGSNGNPGTNECLFGEVQDVLAAAEYLAARPDVDPERLYLVGHSTGATLSLLVAELSQRFAAVVAIGPATSTADYGEDCAPLDASREEILARSPGAYIEDIRSPVIMVEGAVQPSNADVLYSFGGAAGPSVSFVVVPGLDHFSVLAPTTHLLADAMAANLPLTLSAESVAARASRGPAPR